MPLPILGILSAVVPLIDKLIPDPQAAAKAKLDAMAMAQRGELAELDAAVQMSLAQARINEAEAKLPGFMGLVRAGWRPATGWFCAFAFGYSYVLQPMLMFGVYAFGTPDLIKQMAGLPELDIGLMMPVLLGMLGLSWNRSNEKQKEMETR